MSRVSEERLKFLAEAPIHQGSERAAMALELLAQRKVAEAARPLASNKYMPLAEAFADLDALEDGE